jgi:S1-C subfamily serine protease
MRSICLVLLMVLGAGLLSAQADQAWLGLKLEVVETADAKKLGIDGGLKVTRVDANSPAAEAGVEIGDILLSAGEDTLTTIEQMKTIMAAKRPGDILSLGVRRNNGRNEPMMITLGSVADKDDKFKDDARVKELRDRLRELDAERRRVREELDERLKQLGAGKADPEVKPTPEPQPEVKPEVKPETHKPERVELKVTLDASFVNVSAAEAEELKIDGGIRVTAVTQGGAAEEAGLKVDDVVILVDSDSVAGTGDLRSKLADRKPGDRLEIEVLRKDKRVKLTVVLRAKGGQ